MAVLGDKLYAIGGRDSQRHCLNRAALQLQCLRSVECLDLSVPNNQWTTVAPMTSPRRSMGAVVTDGKIYIVKGYPSSSVQCFNPNDGPAGRWTVVSNISKFASAY